MASVVRRNTKALKQDMVEEARSAIEREIASHADAIIQLKGRLNFMTPISKVPPEILSEIFTLIAIEHYADQLRSPKYAPTRAYGWIVLSHVCRAWRDVALNTPRLWSRIVVTRVDIVQEIFARSKKAPLWITVNITYANDVRIGLLDTVMKESQRLKELRISGPVRIVQGLSTKWTGRADLLESVHISDSNSFDPGAITPYNPVIPTLFSEYTPNLRVLNIHKLIVAWDNPLFCSTLTHLTYVSRFDGTPRLGSFAQLLTVLDNMPALETLELSETIPRLPEDLTTLPSAQRSITLPRLRALTLFSDVLDCANLLNHLSLPANTRMVITGRTERGVQELVRIFGEHLAHSKPLLTLRLSPVYSAQVYMRGWRSSSEPKGDDASDAELCLDAFPHSRSLHYLMSEATFISRVQRLEILPSFTAWEWQTLFGRLPDLRALNVMAHPEHDGLLEALSVVRDARAEEGQGGPGTLYVPKLRTVQMSGIRFGCPHSNHESEYLEEMLEWFILRCNYGMPIRRLRLRVCINAGEEDVNRLREVVADVDWDGEEIFDDDEDDDEDDDMMDDEDDMYYDDEDVMLPMDWHALQDEEDVDFWMIPFGF